MSSASAIRKAATLPAPASGAHSNSAPQAHRLGMTPNLTGTLRPQRAQVIFPIIDLRFTTPSAPLDNRTVARARQVLHREPLAVVDIAGEHREVDDLAGLAVAHRDAPALARDVRPAVRAADGDALDLEVIPAHDPGHVEESAEEKDRRGDRHDHRDDVQDPQEQDVVPTAEALPHLVGAPEDGVDEVLFAHEM